MPPCSLVHGHIIICFPLYSVFCATALWPRVGDLWQGRTVIPLCSKGLERLISGSSCVVILTGPMAQLVTSKGCDRLDVKSNIGEVTRSLFFFPSSCIMHNRSARQKCRRLHKMLRSCDNISALKKLSY